jgi:hypothetical protein
MITTSFETRVKIQEIVENQFPEFILDENPKAPEFLKQYYISQEFQGGPVDIVENLDQYLKLDNLSSEVIIGETELTSDISESSQIIQVKSTKGYPNKYGLLKIDDEIITYTGITTNSFTGCIRGFSGITTYHSNNLLGELVFEETKQNSHKKNSKVFNLSTLFLKEFYKKIKYSLTPGLENYDFVKDLNASTFIKEAKTFYQSKGTEESFRILFNILYGIDPTIVNLENLLIKPSAAEFLRREILLIDVLSGDPFGLVGQTIRKTKDFNTQASVSSVEPITRSGKTYYKISLFVGYGDNSLIDGVFTISPKTKVSENVLSGSSIISVDSTIGFEKSGVLECNGKNISYTDKTINQFLNCQENDSNSIVTDIPASSIIRSDDLMYGYEYGNVNKKIEFRVTGVLNKFIPKGEIFSALENEKIYVKNLGEKIINPSDRDKTFKEIFANSWIYNTSSRFQVQSINGTTFTLLINNIDKSSLKVGDEVEILLRNQSNVIFSGAIVNSINNQTKQINLSNLSGFVSNSLLKYDIRRKLKKSSSSFVPIKYGNNTVLCDIQNVYNENNQYFYVASNSLPEYPITKKKIEIVLEDASGFALQGFSSNTLKYSIISFSDDVPFITGDSIYYKSSSNKIQELEEGELYYVEVLSNKNQIRLYTSRSFIYTDNYIQFSPLPSGSGNHTFTLSVQGNKLIEPQKLLKKFPSDLNLNLQNGSRIETKPGTTGLLINGVEILNYKSSDVIYYGPLTDINVISGGNGYDLINTPIIEVPNGSNSKALIQPILEGNLVDVIVDPQDFDINKINSITIEGGNSKEVVLEPVISEEFREVSFDARLISLGGGVQIEGETITFLTPHNFADGEEIIYDSNQNNPLGIGTFGGSNLDQNQFLSPGNIYISKNINNRTIQLYNSFSDFISGINTIGITTTNTQGIHKFKQARSKKVLKNIKIINSGSKFQNRKIIIKSSSVDTLRSIISFNKHGFNHGDIISYETTETPISGLSTTSKYYIFKIDDNKFRVCDAGQDGNNRDNFLKNNYSNFLSNGSGYHIFKYPDIKLNIDVEYSGTIGIITATPIIDGTIVDAYLYENGENYGSNILNFHKKPDIKIKSGKKAQLKPIISNGRITGCEIQNAGSEYFSPPNIVVVGEGIGAKLRPIIENGSIKNIIIINPGINYNPKNTYIKVFPRGSGAILDPTVRKLTLNNFTRYGLDNLISLQNKSGLEYVTVGYSTDIGSSSFNDNGLSHSPIIGWAYDGNPIYGPYGYSDPEDINSSIKNLSTGYELDTSSIPNRPQNFEDGFFVDDYKFTNIGDLDINNGRFCKTPEFKNGVYAYFVGVETDIQSNKLIPKFPYFIGNFYRSNLIDENNLLNQDFDFNNSNLIRNTYPYNVSEIYADNDFLIESNELIDQFSIIESVTKGTIESIEVIESGEGYHVNDIAVFNNENTNGGGLSAYVSEILGKKISNIQSTVITYDNCAISKNSQNEVLVSVGSTHEFKTDDTIIISNLSEDLYGLTKNHKIIVPSGTTYNYSEIPSNDIVGLVTDIYLFNIPQTFSIDDTIQIGSELMTILNIFPETKVIRVKRGLSTSSHKVSDPIKLVPNSFTIKINGQLPLIDSKINDKIYFNPHQSVGIGTTEGLNNSIVYSKGSTIENINAPTQSLYIPNHPFKTNQLVKFRKNTSSNPILVSNSASDIPFFILNVNNQQDLYVINKSKDYIGIVTNVGLTTTTNGLFFIGNGSDAYDYSVESNYRQITAKIQNAVSNITLSEEHNLLENDKITLEVVPNQSVGIGTTIPLKLSYNQLYDKILINSVGFSSSGINTESNSIIIPNHGLKTGDKIFYEYDDISASGLSTGSYFVYRKSDNEFKLTTTYLETLDISPNFVEIDSVGGQQQKISLISPQISVYKNNNLRFDTSDSSLNGYQIKIFYDKNFKNEFVSVGKTELFLTTQIGNIGISTEESYFEIKYSEELPSRLYYNIEKLGYVSESDSDVVNGNEIVFKNSLYNGKYNVYGIGSTTFKISLDQIPEELYYDNNSVYSYKYYTNSLSETGGIYNVGISFGGANYKSLPTFEYFITESGKNAFILPKSKSVGKLEEVKIFDPGFEYSSDKTLKPESFISPLITLKNVNEVSKIDIIDGGKNYTSVPDFVLVHPENRNVVEGGFISASLNSSSISKINIIRSPKGLDSLTYELYSVNNSNGISIESIESTPVSGIITCYLKTPIFGFGTPPFQTGDKVFVEGIKKQIVPGQVNNGDGFNSSDYGYVFFDVISYLNVNPAKLEYKLPNNKNNPGLTSPIQNSYAFIINEKNYPKFFVNQVFSNFSINERLLVFSSQRNNYEEKNIIITDFTKEYIKIYGTDTLKEGDIIKGKNTGSVATIRSIEENLGLFEIDYSLRKDFGWESDTGKLNQDYQVLPDNDYYQNLSYTIKSPVEFEKLITPVNSLVHTVGFKNFADVGITSSAKTSIGSSMVLSTNVYNFISEERVDAIHNFDFSQDINVVDNKSKFIRLQNTRLSDYIECRTNRALNIDDISPLFSNRENTTTNFVDILVFESREDYSRTIVQVIDPNTSEIQSLELFTFKDNNNIFTFQKQYLSITNDFDGLGEYFGEIDSFDKRTTIKFLPYKPLSGDYDIKVYRSQFNTLSSGIGTQNLNSIKLVGVNTYVEPNGTSSIIKFNINDISSLFANIQIINPSTLERNFVELYLSHDKNNSYISKYYLDSNEINGTYSDIFNGEFESVIDLSSETLSLNYISDENSTVLIKSEIIEFAPTTLGIATYTFISPKQNEIFARSVQLFSSISEVNSSGISTIFSISKNLFSTIKSYIRIGIGSESYLHQVLMVHNNTNVVTTQYPYLSVSDVSGIGTFGGVYNENNIELIFYPDSNYIGDNVSIQSYNEALYTFNDTLNIPANLDFGTVTKSISLAQYNALDGSRINRTSFDMRNNNNPIFMKTFDPSDSEVLDSKTGLFKIRDHFFSTGERLIYTPNSTFVGSAVTSVGIGATLNSSGIVTTLLPSEVYAIKIDNDTFKISTREDYSLLGIAVTFTSYGFGNAHQLEMYKKSEKTIITVDGVIQTPVAYTSISHNLAVNVGIAETYIALSGISSIYPQDALKIDNEFMKINVVGFATNFSGPITGLGTHLLVQVDRGIFGTTPDQHSSLSEARIYSGTYNILGNTIHFKSPPRGDSSNRRNSSNLLVAKSTFSGRVFLKQNYNDNVIYDDISRSFDGISQEYPITIQGISTSGIETGSGILLINEIFQTPTTENNPQNNYSYEEISGETNVIFSGITSFNGSIIKTDYDVNQNQLPRGGLIVSLGTTSGIGYAPLVGASVTAIVDTNGTIQAVGITTLDVNGSGYNGNVFVNVVEDNHVGSSASVTASVGIGGSLSFNVIDGGSGYVNPKIFVSSPSYQYLPITGVFRRGIGQTTDSGVGLLLNVEVGSTETELQPISAKNADASELINANKQLIAEVAVGIMLDNYPGFIFPEGNLKYVSDVVSVLESLAFNLRYGGNDRVYDIAKLYIDNNDLNGEEELIYTFDQSKQLSIQAMRNEPIAIGTYSNLEQYFDNTIIGDASGVSGIYSPGDCSDTASSIDSFIGIVTFSIRDDNIPTSRVAVTTSFFEVTDFQIVKQGYGFQIGDIFKPVGLVTDGRLSSPIQEFELTVLDVFNDSFSSWRFGQLDYIDSIKVLQNGVRTRFPLFYRGDLLSFEINSFDQDSERIDLNAVLLILINGVIQTPNKNYVFTGGTTFSFTTPPKPEDNISIFFYRGSREIDSVSIEDVRPSIKVGDNVKIEKNDLYPESIAQNDRTVYTIFSSDTIETDVYSGPGIDIENEKPITWTKQKSDKLIYGDIVSKARNSLESLVFPSSKIIKDFSESDNELFVDNSQFFNYESNNSPLQIIRLGGLIIEEKNLLPGNIVSSVSSNGTIQSLIITDEGSGYIGTSITVSFSAPEKIGVGVGTIASATVSISDGKLSYPVNIINPGFGYTNTNPPNVLVPFPDFKVDIISNISSVEGFSGIITGISTSIGTGQNSLALKFFLRTNELTFESLQSGYPIFIHDTNIGNGIVSIDTDNNSVVGIGTSFLDNIYYIHSINSFGNNAVIITNVEKDSNIIGISQTGTPNNPIGKFSWGRFSNFDRSSNPVSIAVTGLVVDHNLSGFPNIQRRGYGLGDGGGLRDTLPQSI